MARPRQSAPRLKSELAFSAERLVSESGPGALTVRAVAAAAGVSANAPYHYFPGGVVELLASTAITGFVELREALAALPLAAPGVERVAEIVARYVQFGVERANLYRAMFDVRMAEPLETGTTRGGGEPTFASLRVLKAAAYDDLVNPLIRLEAQRRMRAAHAAREAPGLVLAAMAHGLVGEFIDEGLLRPESDTHPWTDERRAMTADVTDILLHGLLARPSHPPGAAEPVRSETMVPEEDPAWEHYPETVLEFSPGGDVLQVDLREAVSAETAQALADLGLPDAFAVLTANNPRGRTVSTSENISRMLELKRQLRAHGQLWLRVDGVSPDRLHREEGVAVAVARETAVHLGRKFEQSAIYWCELGVFWVVGALVKSEAIRLPFEGLK
jgi:AcrR family transcriptional regulator